MVFVVRGSTSRCCRRSCFLSLAAVPSLPNFWTTTSLRGWRVTLPTTTAFLLSAMTCSWFGAAKGYSESALASGRDLGRILRRLLVLPIPLPVQKPGQVEGDSSRNGQGDCGPI